MVEHGPEQGGARAPSGDPPPIFPLASPSGLGISRDAPVQSHSDLAKASLPQAPEPQRNPTLLGALASDLRAAGVSLFTIVKEGLRGVAAEGVRFAGGYILGGWALQAAVDQSESTLTYLGIATTLLLVADQLDTIWARRVNECDRRFYRRLQERLIETIGRSTLADLSDPEREGKLATHYNRAADVSNLIERTAALPSFITKVALSGIALVSADWRILGVVGVAVLPGFLLKSRQVTEDHALELGQASEKNVVSTIVDESYRTEGMLQMALGGLSKRIATTASQLQAVLDKEKDAHERRQSARVLLTTTGYYAAMFGGFWMLLAQYQAGAMEVGTFAFLLYQLKDFGEETAGHGETYQQFKELSVEARAFYEFVTPVSQRGRLQFPKVHHMEIDCAQFQRSDFTLQLPKMRLDPGDLLVVHGGNGAGKTTLLKYLAFGVGPVSGSVTVGGVPVQEVRFSEWQKRIAYCGAQPALLLGRSIREILQGADGTEAYFKERLNHPLLAELLAKLMTGYGLETRVGAGLPKGRELSTGELHKLAIVAAVVPRPEILFLDEVTSNQDDDHVAATGATLDALRAQGTIVVFATHSKKFDGRATQILRVSAGVAEVQPKAERQSPPPEQEGGSAQRVTA